MVTQAVNLLLVFTKSIYFGMNKSVIHWGNFNRDGQMGTSHRLSCSFLSNRFIFSLVLIAIMIIFLVWTPSLQQEHVWSSLEHTCANSMSKE